MEGTPLAILLSKEMSNMFCSLSSMHASSSIDVASYLELSDGLDDINDDRGLYKAQNLYEPG